MSPGESSFRLAYEISPIYLTGGIAGTLPGATVPLISYTEGNIFGSILAAGIDRSLDDFFAHFLPVPGSSLVHNVIGMYPLANQSVAANAIIFEPLRISLLMICPVRGVGGYRSRQAIMTSLKRTIDAHNLAGGTYSIATPNYLYVDAVMTGFTDAGGGETKQAQYRYQLDFLQPLISQAAAEQSYNNLMSKVGAQTQLTPNANGEITWSNTGNTVNNPGSGASPEIVPPTRVDPGMGFAPSNFSAADDAVSGFAANPEVTSAVTPPTPAAIAATNTGLLNIPTVTY